MSKASDVYNALPISTREKSQGVILQTQITMLLIEKERVMESYRLHIGKIDEHLRNCSKSLELWEKEQPTAEKGKE